MGTPAMGDGARRPVGSPAPDELRSPEEVVRDDIHQHGGELYHVVRKALDDDQLAAEVVQDVFVRAWRADDRYDASRASRRTWLFAIARNAVVDAVRHRERRPRGVRDPEEQDVTTSEADDAVLLQIQLRAALQEVSPEHRRAIVEVHLRGRPYAEVADELGVPVGTLRSRVYYGLRALREALEKQGWTDERA